MSELPGQLSLRFSALKLRSHTQHGAVYTGRSFIGEDISLAVLSKAAGADADLREAFGAAVRHYRQAGGAEQLQVHSADIGADQPWVAVRGRSGAGQILAGLTGTAVAALPHAPLPEARPLPAPPVHAPVDAPGIAALTQTPADPALADPPSVLPPPAGTTTTVTARPASARSGSRGAVVIVVAMLAVFGAGVAGLFANRAATEVVSAPPVAGPSVIAEPSQREEPAAVPALRDITPVSLIGPVWQPDDLTVTWAQPGWPFAFRLPPTWTCLQGSFDSVPEAPAQQCLDRDNPAGQRVNLMLWECPTTCTEDEQVRMIETWLDHPDLAVQAGPRLAYVETARNDRGAYSVDLSHFVADPAVPGGPLRWHVGVYVEAPPESTDEVLKILNDIISQTS